MGLGNLFGMLKPGAALANATHDEMRAASANGGAAIIDVREPGEYSSGHIPGAVNLPLSRFDAAKLPQDKPLIFVCASGARSANAARHVLAQGRTDIKNYAPGTMGWMRFGEKVV